MQHITPKRRSSTLRTLLTFEDNRRASEMRLRESKPAKKKTEAENIWNCKVRLLQKSYFNIFHTMIKLSWPHRDCRNRTCMTIKVSTSFNNVPTCSYSVMKRSTNCNGTEVFPPASSKVVSISIGPAISSTMLKSQPPHKAPSSSNISKAMPDASGFPKVRAQITFRFLLRSDDNSSQS